MDKSIKIELDHKVELGGKEMYHNIVVRGNAYNKEGNSDDVTICTFDEDIDCTEKEHEHLVCFHIDEVDELIEAIKLAKRYVDENRGK